MQSAQDVIRQIKEAKKRTNITYDDILDQLTINGSPEVSRTTVRRVFASGSEERASGFNFEKTLLPIFNAINTLDVDKEPPHVKEIKFLMEQIQLKDEIIAEKDKFITRLIDRLDRKDDIISQFITDLRQKDELIRGLMEHNK